MPEEEKGKEGEKSKEGEGEAKGKEEEGAKGKEEEGAKGKEGDDNTPRAMANQIADRLDKKINELSEAEKNVSKKLEEYKDFIKKTETEGKGVLSTPKSDDEIRKEEARSLVEGTGLDPFKE